MANFRSYNLPKHVRLIEVDTAHEKVPANFTGKVGWINLDLPYMDYSYKVRGVTVDDIEFTRRTAPLKDIIKTDSFKEFEQEHTEEEVWDYLDLFIID